MENYNRKVRDRLSKFLHNKRVVIVGPAASIVDTKQKALIDGYDVVVRLNKALPVPNKLKPDIGSRTDILYNCMNPSDECGGAISVSVLKKQNVKFLVGAYPPIEKIGNLRMRLKRDIKEFFTKNRLRYQSFCYTDKGNFMKMWKQLKLPNTGVMAIIDLLRFDLKELYITGITFFKGGYYSQYRNYNEEGILTHMKKFGLHKPDKQLKYMSQILANDKRVKMDQTLQEIVDQTILMDRAYNDIQLRDDQNIIPSIEFEQIQEDPIIKKDLTQNKDSEETEQNTSEPLKKLSENEIQEMSNNSVNLYAKTLTELL